MEIKMRLLRDAFFITVLLAFVLGTTGCGVATPVSTPMPTKVPTRTPAPTVTYTPTLAASPTATLVPVPTSSISDQTAVSLASECRTVVDGLYNLKQATDFEPNQYFQILANIKLQPGYKLDYIDFGDDLGAKPLVYARKSGTAPFQTYADFLKSYGQEMSGERSYAELDHSYDYLDRIQIDETPESYYQFVVLALLGDQFNLYWHGLYNDTKILCDSSDMKYVNDDMKSFDIEFPQDVVSRVEKIDFKPVVVIGENTVTVRFITFTKWGGFFEGVYILEKEKEPMKLIDAQWHPLIEYDCGIAF